MKKTLAIAIALIMALTVVVALASCGYKYGEENQQVINLAQEMTLAELEVAAKAEFEAANIKFTAKSTTSGVGKVLTKFKEKYTWFVYNEFSSSKDQAAAADIEGSLPTGGYYADFCMIQIASNIQTWMNAGYLLNYVPKNDDEIQLNANATKPLVGLYADKLFMYNKSGTDVTLQNIWQLTGKDGALKKVKGSSIQDPTNEGINMAFMIMLTSPESCEKLTAAYKSYFGKDYTKQAGCKNIGYYFIQEYINALTNNHGSDSKVLSNIVATDTTGTVYVVGLNKTKGYNGSENNWHEDLFYSGVDGDVEGYNGFTYNTYLSIPSTSKLPYTACLFARYILTEEGFKAGWKDVGYSSPNSKVSANVDSTANVTYNLDVTKVLQEDGAYTSKNYKDVYKFVTSTWAAAGRASE